MAQQPSSDALPGTSASFFEEESTDDAEEFYEEEVLDDDDDDDEMIEEFEESSSETTEEVILNDEQLQQQRPLDPEGRLADQQSEGDFRGSNPSSFASSSYATSHTTSRTTSKASSEDRTKSPSPTGGTDKSNGFPTIAEETTTTSLRPRTSGSMASSSRQSETDHAPGAAATAGKVTSTVTDSTTAGVKVQRATFPSSFFLLCVAIWIVLIAVGIVVGVTVSEREKKVLDPIDVPTVSPAPTALGETRSPTMLVPTVAPTAMPSESTETFLDVFAQVAGDAVYEEGSSARLAAEWMLTQDPSGTSLNFNVMSQAAWQQRYLLVYLYYRTTDNRQSEWLSCNPPVFVGSQTTDCQFANPTELPGGRLVFDRVPSGRWLSAAHECDWGGISCQTVADDVTGSRLAVTSILLAGQELTGSVVTELVNLPELDSLDLSYNDLEGTLDPVFKGLQTLRLQSNLLSGSVPDNFFDNDSVMRLLNIGNNFMNGTLPNQVGLASQMTALYVFQNNFVGSIPNLGNMPLKIFHGQGNVFQGQLPFDLFFGNWAETLQEWWAFDNQLTGTISTGLGLLQNLQDFRVGRNRFDGPLPQSMYDLTRLFRFEVSENLLTGSVDSAIGNLRNLETFDVTYNELTGTLPEELGRIDTLEVVKTQFNLFSGTMPTDLCFQPSMEVLETDCRPEDNPPVECFCCTSCCQRGTNQCVAF